MTPHPFDDALAAYALGALDRDEAAFLERHLAECDRCRAAVEEARAAATALARGVPQVAPPAALRARVLGDATRGARGMRDPVRAPVPPSGVVRRPRTAPWVAAAAGIVLALGFGSAWLQERGTRRDLMSTVQRAESLLAVRDATVAARDSLLARVLGPEIETVTLASTGAVPSMRLFMDRANRVMVLSARRLPPAAAGRTYQLWGIGADGKPVGLGTFNTGSDHAVVVSIPVEGDPRFRVSAVTEEPEGGSPQPTSAPFLVGSWPSTR